MSIERMLVSSATRAIGADSARLLTRKNSNASSIFIVSIALATAIFGWLFLMRNRSVWWQRVLAVPMIVIGSVWPSGIVSGLFGGNLLAFIVASIFIFLLGVVCTFVSNDKYQHEIAAANADAFIISSNDAFLQENGLSSMENWDLFHDESGVHFKKISTMANAVLYSVVGRRGRRAKLTHDHGRFLSFEILNQGQPDLKTSLKGDRSENETVALDNDDKTESYE